MKFKVVSKSDQKPELVVEMWLEEDSDGYIKWKFKKDGDVCTAIKFNPYTGAFKMVVGFPSDWGVRVTNSGYVVFE